MFKEQFDAHDALEDVRALRKILFESSLNLPRKNIVENSNVISAPLAVANMLYLDQRHELPLTFSDNLVNVTDTGPIKRSMAQNIVDSGLSYDDLQRLYTRFGKRGLVAISSICRFAINAVLRLIPLFPYYSFVSQMMLNFNLVLLAPLVHMTPCLIFGICQRKMGLQLFIKISEASWRTGIVYAK